MRNLVSDVQRDANGHCWDLAFVQVLNDVDLLRARELEDPERFEWALVLFIAADGGQYLEGLNLFDAEPVDFYTLRNWFLHGS